MRRRFLAVSMAVMMVMGLTACGGGESKTEEKKETAETEEFADYDDYTIKMANWFGETHPQNIALQQFADEVAEKTGGKVTVEIYPNSQLGSEDVYINSILEGTLEMSCQGTMMAEYVPAINVAEMPFLFENLEHAKATLGGEIGESIAAKMPEKCGVRCLAWTVNGMREVSSSKSVTDIEDFKGLKLRIPTTSLYVKTFEALGVTPVAMSLSETYTALETGVADGQDNPYATVRASSFYEVQDYILETNHMFSPVEWCINEKFFQSLPKEFQDIITEAAKSAAEYNWELSMKAEQEDKAWLKEQGVEITEVDKDMRAEMIKKLEDAGVYEWVYEEYPGTEDYAEQIRNFEY